MEVVQVNGTRINKAIRYIKSKFANNSHESAQISPYGDDSVPISGIKGVKMATSTDAIQVILGYFNRNNIAKEGEKRIFSQKSDESISFYIHLKNDGTCEIGGSDDYLVRYSDLKSGFDQLKSDMNDLITKYNLHIHPVSGAETGVTTSIQTATTADISGCKIEEIKTL